MNISLQALRFHWIAPSGFETHQLREREEEEANRQHTKLKMSEK